MPNIASIFKAEIARLARKEVREECDGLRKTIASQRSEIAALKRRLQLLETAVRRLDKAQGAQRTKPAADAAEQGGDSDGGRRFAAKGLASNRKRLGLSAADFGLLVGVSGQSIYAWETGKAQPRARATSALAALRGIGKREVAAKLAALKT